MLKFHFHLFNSQLPIYHNQSESRRFSRLGAKCAAFRYPSFAMSSLIQRNSRRSLISVSTCKKYAKIRHRQKGLQASGVDQPCLFSAVQLVVCSIAGCLPPNKMIADINSRSCLVRPQALLVSMLVHELSMELCPSPDPISARSEEGGS